MPPIPFIEAMLSASPTAAVFIIAVLALLVAWQALAFAARTLHRDRSNDE